MNTVEILLSVVFGLTFVLLTINDPWFPLKALVGAVVLPLTAVCSPIIILIGGIQETRSDRRKTQTQ